MANSRNLGWQPSGDLPPSIAGMVMFARSIQSTYQAQEFVTRLALCAYKCGHDDATFTARMNQLMEDGKDEQ